MEHRKSIIKRIADNKGHGFFCCADNGGVIQCGFMVTYKNYWTFLSFEFVADEFSVEYDFCGDR